MNCPNCGDEIKEKKNFCPNCAAPLNNDVQQEIKITAGSVGIGVGSGNKVRIGKIENHINNRESGKIPCTYTVKGKGIKYDKLKTFSTFAMVIGFIGSLITIITSFINFKSTNLGFTSIILPFAIVLCGIGVYLYAICKDLSKTHGFTWLRPFKLVSIRLKKLDDGRVVRIKIAGNCDECNGKINFFKNFETGHVIGYCENNRDHQFEFDHTDFTAKRIKK
ncbi:hypothetical protein DFR58_12938 [Anaerobacterium chartisolvens]|uniref:Zinc-ribbon domain-containing protein n=1 Tax=Anaerobacterium chartisolvens TaxID=1297424 RepID=A0A369AQE2_9FIRM|nr:zinc ribbon domain-containing protein [Anaerobacterium chartisolvens]RCX10446.1 hypothetical protein DFR58_12938 [Anaerobacterium chartisolvens]